MRGRIPLRKIAAGVRATAFLAAQRHDRDHQSDACRIGCRGVPGRQCQQRLLTMFGSVLNLVQEGVTTVFPLEGL